VTPGDDWLCIISHFDIIQTYKQTRRTRIFEKHITYAKVKEILEDKKKSYFAIKFIKLFTMRLGDRNLKYINARECCKAERKIKEGEMMAG
jgi:AraC-like DNA-binding protein